jgi:hypothetical protein
MLINGTAIYHETILTRITKLTVTTTKRGHVGISLLFCE